MAPLVVGTQAQALGSRHGRVDGPVVVAGAVAGLVAGQGGAGGLEEKKGRGERGQDQSMRWWSGLELCLLPFEDIFTFYYIRTVVPQ